MNVTLLSAEQIKPRLPEFHILTYAEEGFAPLNIHGRQYGIPQTLLARFADEVNRKRESGSLHPHAPISAVPRSLVRDQEDSAALCAEIVEFLRANTQTIRAKRVVFDFRTPTVAAYAIAAIGDAMRSPEAEGIEEAVIIE